MARKTAKKASVSKPSKPSNEPKAGIVRYGGFRLPAVRPVNIAPVGDDPPCPQCGGEMWDNRKGKQNPRAPDFRCKTKTCEGIIWPPKGLTVVKSTPARDVGYVQEDKDDGMPGIRWALILSPDASVAYAICKGRVAHGYHRNYVAHWGVVSAAHGYCRVCNSTTCEAVTRANKIWLDAQKGILLPH